MSDDMEGRPISSLEWRLRTALGRLRCARYFHRWEQTRIGWPYEEHYYCARDWPLPCTAITYDEERALYGIGWAIRFDLERIPPRRAAFRWYGMSRWAR